MKDLTLAELKEAYTSVFGCLPPPAASRAFMCNNLIYQQNCKQAGGLPPQTVRLLHRLALEGRDKPNYRPTTIRPGTKLVRLWQGEPHEVTVTPEGFIYRGAPFSSLTAIARHITGSSWNGHVFFGLRKVGADA
jgi:hypothetical protein